MATTQVLWTMVRRAFCLLLLVRSCTCGELSVGVRLSPSSLSEPITERINITITCFAYEKDSNNYRRNRRYYGYDEPNAAARYDVIRIRVLMASEDPSSWTPLAQISNLEPDVVYRNPTFVTHNTSGAIHSVSYATFDPNSELRATFEGPTVLAVRSFRCDAVFLDKKNMETAKYKYSESKLDTSRMNGLIFFEAVAVEKKSLLNKIKNISSSETLAFSGVNASWASTKRDIQNRLALMKARLTEAVKAQNAKMDLLVQTLQTLFNQTNQKQADARRALEVTYDMALASSYLMLWPNGSYTLPKPASGCPFTGGDVWPESWRKQHTESTDRNYDEVSENNHLAQPVLTREGGQNFVFMRFCVKVNGNTSARSHWPRGSYCINKVKACPPDFSGGNVQWDGEDVNSASTSSDTPSMLPDGNFDKSESVFEYCCRSDSPADQPVDLPRSQPFYLYRHGGQCQQVAGMSVTEEFIYFDTENNNNADKANGHYPDVELDNIRLHLCYYAQE